MNAMLPTAGAGWSTVLFLDLDATLIRGPFEPVVFPRICGAIARQAGLQQAEVRQLVYAENVRRLADEAVPAVLAMDWDDILLSVARRLGVSVDVDATALANAHASPPYARLLDGAQEALDQLVAPHRALVVATNGLARYQLPVLAGLGIAHYFTAVLTPDVNGALKDSIAFYGAWATAGDLRISLGDRIEDDVIAPRSYGFRSVWKLNDPEPELVPIAPCERPERARALAGHGVRPDAIVVSLHEVPEVVRQLEAGLC